MWRPVGTLPAEEEASPSDRLVRNDIISEDILAATKEAIEELNFIPPNMFSVRDVAAIVQHLRNKEPAVATKVLTQAEDTSKATLTANAFCQAVLAKGVLDPVNNPPDQKFLATLRANLLNPSASVCWTKESYDELKSTMTTMAEF